MPPRNTSNGSGETRVRNEDLDEVMEGWQAPGRLGLAARRAAAGMGPESARTAVDAYYRLQKHRVALGNQLSAIMEASESDDVIRHFYDAAVTEEKDAGSVLGYWAKAKPVGEWSLGITGVGPVLAAGLLAHIDITRAPTAGHIWRFAGLDPTTVWGKGQKRPWNARLKVLCWKLGDSFVKNSGRESDVYGHVYRARKDIEVEKNEAHAFADQAAQTLAERNITDPSTKACYESGMLPPGRIDLRARRYAVKLFLSHWQYVAYVEHYGKEPPLPYPVVHLGHAHVIPVPSYP